MANINGIEIKAIKTFLGTEGYARQGNVYLDKKKIGFFSEDGNGGCDWIDFECDKEIFILISGCFIIFTKGRPLFSFKISMAL